MKFNYNYKIILYIMKLEFVTICFLHIESFLKRIIKFVTINVKNEKFLIHKQK